MTFGTYALANANNPEQRLTADRAFVALSLFNILRFPLTMLPVVVTSLIQVGVVVGGVWMSLIMDGCGYVIVMMSLFQASVSVKRISKFLLNEELDPNMIDWTPELDHG